MADVTVPATWYDVATARTDWPDAPSKGANADVLLQTLLNVAKRQVQAYAPKFTADDGTKSLGYIDPITGDITAVDDSTVPPDYREAQLMQARNIWNSIKVDPSNGELGDGTFVQRPFPLDWMVKQLIRPTSALPWVG